jgi:hypothetical protein
MINDRFCKIRFFNNFLEKDNHSRVCSVLRWTYQPHTLFWCDIFRCDNLWHDSNVIEIAIENAFVVCLSMVYYAFVVKHIIDAIVVEVGSIIYRD